MTIRPVDMQVVLPHATDVGRLQAEQNSQTANTQQLFAEKLQREAQMRQGQVQEASRIEHSKVTRNKERDQQGSKKKRNKQGNAPKEPKSEEHKESTHVPAKFADPILGKNLDISS